MALLQQLIFASMLLAASPGVASAALQCDLLTTGSYTCSRGGAVVAVGAPIAVFVEGSWHSHGDGSLKLARSTPLSGHTAGLGAYRGTELRWLAGAVPFHTRVLNYAAAPGLADGAAVFSYELPQGANTTGNSHALHTDFPAFATMSHASSALSWSGDFVTAGGGVTTGTEGGPVLFSDTPSPTSRALLTSPLSHFLTSSSATAAHDGRPVHWAGGLSASIKAVPAGFNHSFILAAGLGATDTLYNWGQLVMRLTAGADGGIPKVFDQTLAYLSYQTDNGGQYCFCNQGCDAKLLQMREYLKALGVPIRLVSFQGGWWTNPQIHTPKCAPWCVTSWTPNKTKVPMGLAAFHDALGLPLQLYAPYFCDDTTYDQANGGNWSFLPGTCGGGFKVPSPNNSLAFYSWFFEGGVANGMVAFEPDFMNVQAKCVPEFTDELGMMAEWMAGMADAGKAMTPTVPIQFCMATPYELMESTRHSTVTNFRASNDFFYGTSFDIGASSLLIWALGAVPSKDTFWTTDNTGVVSTCDPRGENAISNHTCGCPTDGCPADHNNRSAVLHTLLAVMSMGPVGFSDALGQTDAALINRTCRADGLLLKPSKPLTTIDRLIPGAPAVKGGSPSVLASFAAAASQTRVGGPPISASTTVMAWYVLAFGAWGEESGGATFEISTNDLWPAAAPLGVGDHGGVLVHKHGAACVDGAPLSGGCATRVEGCCDQKIVTLQSPAINGSRAIGSNNAPVADDYYVVVPECKSGWALLGELNKFASLSPQRFPDGVLCTDSGLTVSVHGAPHETVHVTAANALLNSVHVVAVDVGATGTRTLSCSAGSCSRDHE